MHPDKSFSLKGWHTLVGHKNTCLKCYMCGLRHRQFQVTTLYIACKREFHINCFLFFHCCKAFDEDHLEDWDTAEASIAAKAAKKGTYWSKPKSYLISSMSQVVLPVITQEMKTKVCACHCYLNDPPDNNNNNNNNNNNAIIEETTTELLPGNHPVNPPASFIANPSVAAVKAGMLACRMRLWI